MGTHVTMMMLLSVGLLLPLLTVTVGEERYVYMDSKEACGYSIHMSNLGMYKVQSHTEENMHKNISGFFPCYHKFLSYNNVVCIQQQFVNFYNCTTRLNYYTMKSDIKYVSELDRVTPDRTIDCKSDTRNEWCTTERTNVLIELETTQLIASIQDVFFILEVARIDAVRTTFMFLDCGSKYHLQHSQMRVGLVTGEGDSCVKTFTYYDQADQHKSKICLKFITWSKTRQCSSYRLQVFNDDSDRFQPVMVYKCSENKPEVICVDGPSMTLKMIRVGNLTEEKGNFILHVWDNHKEDVTEEEEVGNGNTVVIVICVIVGIIIILAMIIACCWGKCKGSGYSGGGISLPSLPSFDDDDD